MIILDLTILESKDGGDNLSWCLVDKTELLELYLDLIALWAQMRSKLFEQQQKLFKMPSATRFIPWTDWLMQQIDEIFFFKKSWKSLQGC